MLSNREVALIRWSDKVLFDDPTKCWLWTGARTSRGYGQIWLLTERRSTGAHRHAYELFIGPIPDGLLICHHCDNPPCVNPRHLYAGTHLDNRNDMVTRGRSREGIREREKTHCPHGHPYDEANTLIKRSGARMCRECGRQQMRRRRSL